MRFTTLGKTGLNVSRIALGTWQFSGKWGAFDRQEAVRLIRGASDAGINFIDTAYAYGFGQAESVIGTALDSVLRHNRDEVVIATKGGVRPTGEGGVRDSSPQWLRRGLEESLRQLGTGFVDIYLVHWPDDKTPLAVTAEAVSEFVEAGLVRHAGVSNYTLDQLSAFSAVQPADVMQPPYSLLRRGIEEEMLPYCREHDIGVCVYGTLAHGLLTGKYDANARFDQDDWRATSPVFQGERFRKNVAVVDRLRDYASTMQIGLPALVTGWALNKPGVHTAIVGSSRESQLKGILAAAELELSCQQVDDLEAIAALGAPIGGPSPEGGVSE